MKVLLGVFAAVVLALIVTSDVALGAYDRFRAWRQR